MAFRRLDLPPAWRCRDKDTREDLGRIRRLLEQLNRQLADIQDNAGDGGGDSGIQSVASADGSVIVTTEDQAVDLSVHGGNPADPPAVAHPDDQEFRDGIGSWFWCLASSAPTVTVGTLRTTSNTDPLTSWLTTPPTSPEVAWNTTQQPSWLRWRTRSENDAITALTNQLLSPLGTNACLGLRARPAQYRIANQGNAHVWFVLWADNAGAPDPDNFVAVGWFGNTAGGGTTYQWLYRRRIAAVTTTTTIYTPSELGFAKPDLFALKKRTNTIDAFMGWSGTGETRLVDSVAVGGTFAGLLTAAAPWVSIHVVSAHSSGGLAHVDFFRRTDDDQMVPW